MPYKIYSANNSIIQRLNPKPFRLSQPRYCSQNNTEFYTFDVNAGADEINYCPQNNTGFYTIDTYPNTDISVTVLPSSVLENSGTPLVFTFTLAQAIAHNTTVNYSVGGTATSGVDYPNQTGTATITAGQTSVSVSITPTGDTTVESDETIIITIKNAIANSQFIAFGSQISATGTITNDD